MDWVSAKVINTSDNWFERKIDSEVMAQHHYLIETKVIILTITGRLL
jgi:hypothetical protein